MSEPGSQRWKAPSELWQKLKPLAREMRISPTPAEDALWEHLRDRRLRGMKFRRQHAIERFIVDFYCSEARLVIEVDGDVREYSHEQDAIRQAFLEQQGLVVLRFSNDQVLNELSVVVRGIESQVQSSSKPPLSARRRGDGGEVTP